MLLNIRHETRYQYTTPVKRSVQSLRLTPRQDESQRVVSWNVQAPGKLYAQHDAHGNVVHLLTLDQPHTEIRILVSGTVVTGEGTTARLHDMGHLSPLAYVASTALTRPDEAIAQFAASHSVGKGDTEASLLKLAAGICERVRYTKGSTDVGVSAAQAFERGMGVCQDQSHVFIACCRAQGLPARYVSGYLYTGTRDDAASHAWIDVWLRDEGCWLPIDVTHACLMTENHCRLAVGRDYLEASPVRGVRRGGGGEEMTVEVSLSATQQ